MGLGLIGTVALILVLIVVVMTVLGKMPVERGVILSLAIVLVAVIVSLLLGMA